MCISVRFRAASLPLLSLLLAGLNPPGASAAATPPVRVTVSAEPVGRTPAIIGYNMGENLPGSNVTAWLRYSGMNGARFWWSQDAWPAPPPAWGAGETGRARFEAERARLRANPVAGADRAAHSAAIARAYGGTPAGTRGDCYSLSELHRLGVKVLIMMSRSPARHAFDTAAGEPDWFARWSYWRGVYLNALYLAEHYDVERFQLFNEPDHPNSKGLSQADYVRRLQLGSDAMQAAIADVNRRLGRALRVQVSAPVTAGLSVFQRRTGRPDPRDAQTGWGELVMRHRHDDFAGRTDRTWPLFHTYAFQSYGRDPTRISIGLPELRALIAAANGGTPLPIIVSEMNVSTAANFSKTTDTLDTPAYFAAFGAIATAYVNAGIDEIYVFRLTQNAYEGAGGVKKNGTHFIRQDDPRKDILGSTKGAEAVRLLMRGFKGGHVRFAPPITEAPGVLAAASRDEASGAFHLMVASRGTARNLILDLSPWNLPAGAWIAIEEVSTRHHGDVRSVVALPREGRIELPMAADAVVLLTVRPELRSDAQVVPLVRSRQGAWRVEPPNAAAGGALLAIRASAARPTRVRVYCGEGPAADLLGQIRTEPSTRVALVDVTPRIGPAGSGPIVFHFVADDPREQDAFTVEAVELRVFGRRD